MNKAVELMVLVFDGDAGEAAAKAAEMLAKNDVAYSLVHRTAFYFIHHHVIPMIVDCRLVRCTNESMQHMLESSRRTTSCSYKYNCPRKVRDKTYLSCLVEAAQEQLDALKRERAEGRGERADSGLSTHSA